MAEKCMECGTLRDVLTKNHLMQEHGISMTEYREIYGKRCLTNPLAPIINNSKLQKDFKAENDIKVLARKLKPAWIEYSVG